MSMVMAMQQTWATVLWWITPRFLKFPYTAGSGVDSFTIQVSDGQHSVTEQVTVNVTQINDAPTVYRMPDKLVTAGNDF